MSHKGGHSVEKERRRRTGPNGQLDGRCAIIASAKIGSL